MTYVRNVGSSDRVVRVVAAVGFGVAAFMAPLSLSIRLAGFGSTALFLLYSALSGTCLGYRLMGRSTCPLKSR
jgi:hypothetical protein